MIKLKDCRCSNVAGCLWRLPIGSFRYRPLGAKVKCSRISRKLRVDAWSFTPLFWRRTPMTSSCGDLCSRDRPDQHRETYGARAGGSGIPRCCSGHRIPGTISNRINSRTSNPMIPRRSMMNPPWWHHMQTANQSREKGAINFISWLLTGNAPEMEKGTGTAWIMYLIRAIRDMRPLLQSSRWSRSQHLSQAFELCLDRLVIRGRFPARFYQMPRWIDTVHATDRPNGWDLDGRSTFILRYSYTASLRFI